MSQQRRGQEEAVGPSRFMWNIFRANFTPSVMQLSFGRDSTSARRRRRRLLFCRFLDADEVARSIRAKQPSAAPSEHRIKTVSAR